MNTRASTIYWWVWWAEWTLWANAGAEYELAYRKAQSAVRKACF